MEQCNNIYVVSTSMSHRWAYMLFSIFQPREVLCYWQTLMNCVIIQLASLSVQVVNTW